MPRLIDVSFAAPAENLAFDEVLLNEAEAGSAGACLRFWESPVRFVVVGVGQMLAREAHEAHCAADGIPILRRCSAGGCVLQGPGSLNYTLVFPLAAHPAVKSLHGSYDYILGRLAQSFERHGAAVRAQGICDLALDGRKVSGNAQRRRRNAILHHGTLVYAPDYEGMDRYVREPEDRPDYRGARGHGEFVGALPFTPDALRALVLEAFPEFQGVPELQPSETQCAAMQTLVREKYTADAWIYRR